MTSKRGLRVGVGRAGSDLERAAGGKRDAQSFSDRLNGGRRTCAGREKGHHYQQGHSRRADPHGQDNRQTLRRKVLVEHIEGASLLVLNNWSPGKTPPSPAASANDSYRDASRSQQTRALATKARMARGHGAQDS